MLASFLGVKMMGVSGELAAQNSKGPGTFQVELLNQLYGVEETELEARTKIYRL